MPCRLTRYVLIEILKIFVVALVAMTLLILMIGIARELLRRGLGPLAVIQLLPYVLPISLQFAFPATALFSVCCVYGRMAADGEVATVGDEGVRCRWTGLGSRLLPGLRRCSICHDRRIVLNLVRWAMRRLAWFDSTRAQRPRVASTCVIDVARPAVGAVVVASAAGPP